MILKNQMRQMSRFDLTNHLNQMILKNQMRRMSHSDLISRLYLKIQMKH
jgi:hypothetical protein